MCPPRGRPHFVNLLWPKRFGSSELAGQDLLVAFLGLASPWDQDLLIAFLGIASLPDQDLLIASLGLEGQVDQDLLIVLSGAAANNQIHNYIFKIRHISNNNKINIFTYCRQVHTIHR